MQLAPIRRTEHEALVRISHGRPPTPNKGATAGISPAEADTPLSSCAEVTHKATTAWHFMEARAKALKEA